MTKGIDRRVPLFQLYGSFASVGAVLFGGGYAMLPLLEREVVDRRRWCTHEEMGELYAMAQVVPGVIAVNTAILVGHRYRGAAGAVTAMLGMVSAPIMVILLIASSYKAVMASALLAGVFHGLRPAVAGLLLATAVRMLQRGCKARWEWGVAAVAAIAAAASLLGPLGLILGGAGCGLVWHLLARRRERGEAGR